MEVPQMSDGEARGGRRERARLLEALVATVSVVAALLLCTAPAYALLQRGHVASGTFGESGEAASPAKPTALAIDEASGDVYALERSNNRVMVYGPAPERQFVEAWGVGVLDGNEQYERCRAPEKCLPGLPVIGKEGQLDEPVAIAIDNTAGSPSKGDVYVVANTQVRKGAVDKFSSEGAFLGALALKGPAEGALDGVAVDPKGTVFVDREDEDEDYEVMRFSDAVTNKRLDVSDFEVPEEAFSGPRPTRPGLAVDSEDNLYVTYEPGGEDTEAIEEEAETIKEAEKERKKKHEELKDEHPRERLAGTCELHPCFVAKVATKPSASGEGLQETPLIGALDQEPTSGVAEDPSSGMQESGDVYLDQQDGVSAFTSEGSLIQEFGADQLEDGGGAGLAVDGETDEVLVADDLGGRIDVFGPAPVGPPTVEAGSVSAAVVAVDSAELRASIDPDGQEVRYHFEYGTAACATDESACASGSIEILTAAFGAQPVALKLTGLSASTTYHFLVSVEDVGGSPVLSSEATFTTQPSAIEASLPDGRAWELVTPPNKHGASVEAIPHEGGLIEAAADGRSLTYVTRGALAEAAGERGPEVTQVLASKAEDGPWASEDVATPNEAPEEGFNPGGPWEYQFFSSDLTTAFVDPDSSAQLSSETERTIYLRSNTTCAADPLTCYLPVVNTTNDTAPSPKPPFDSPRLVFAGATSDLQHVIISSQTPLTANALSGTKGLYSWSASDGQLELISILPGEGETQATGEVYLGDRPTTGQGMASTAISEDGSRVVWKREEGGELQAGHLYMRELAHDGQPATSYLVDEPEAGVDTGATPPKPVFQTATPDGTKIFFTDSQALTSNAVSNSDAEGAPQELYVFEPEAPAGHRVTDLTPSGEAAGVLGGVLGEGEDSEELSIYFVANAALEAKAHTGDCRGTEAGRSLRCNLYVERYDKLSEAWEPAELLAQLSDEDSPDWGAPASGARGDVYQLKNETSRVSPNGQYLAFMSDLSLTGYDNEDVSSHKPGERRDEEVYLFDSETGKIVCASCNPSGARPAGVYDEQEGSQEGEGLLVDRPQTWEPTSQAGEDPWLAGSIPGWTAVGLQPAFYQSRYLSDKGRLFFNSADALAPVAVPTRTELVDGVEQPVGVENVYEYEPAGVGSCTAANTDGGCVSLISSGESEHESAFLDASEEGEDVFFLTAEKLLPQDPDSAFDIYDARICKSAGSEPCPAAATQSTPPCAGEAECKSGAPSAPTFGSPASASSGGSGNLAAKHVVLSEKATRTPSLTNAQLLAKALAACKKDKSKAKRIACEAHARKRYPTLSELLAKCKKYKRKPARVACEKPIRKKYATTSKGKG
jgi:hypothetical protein